MATQNMLKLRFSSILIMVVRRLVIREKKLPHLVQLFVHWLRPKGQKVFVKMIGKIYRGPSND